MSVLVLALPPKPVETNKLSDLEYGTKKVQMVTSINTGAFRDFASDDISALGHSLADCLGLIQSYRCAMSGNCDDGWDGQSLAIYID